MLYKAHKCSGLRRSSPRPTAATTSSSAATPSSSSTTTCHCKTERETNYTSVLMAELKCHVHEFRWFFPTLTSLSLLWLDFGLDVDQQRVQRKTVGQDEVADVVATDTERLQLSGLSVFEGHLHSFEVSVHTDIHTCVQDSKRKHTDICQFKNYS